MRAQLCWAMAAVTGACGDNTLADGAPLEAAENLTIVAHQDDDLLFMQPDLYLAARRGAGVTNVYVTAGNAHGGVEISDARDLGLLSAYAAVAGADAGSWDCGWISVAGHDLEHCRLAAARLSLVFLDYPDGGKDGSVPDGLLALWEGHVASARTIARRQTTYDRAGLISVLAEIIRITAPGELRTLEVSSTHGDDHPDHTIVGALAVLAIARSSSAPELVSYRGYNIVDEPDNTNPVLFARNLGVLAYYEACANDCAPCGAACPSDGVPQYHRNWMGRRYAIGMRTARGQLRLGDGCVRATGAVDQVVVGDCAAAPTWELDAHGFLRASTGPCLRALSTGAIVASVCDGDDPGLRFLFDDEGHLWSSIVPAPQDDMVTAHLDCVVADGDRLRTALCGDGRAPVWELARTMTATPREITAITRTGRAVRMATLPGGPEPMVCAIETPTRGLMCAPSTAGGALLPAVRIDSTTAPLAIEPESLALGDIDGDGATDACGRDDSGILCALAASGYRAAQWSLTLGGSGPATATDRSLAIAPGGRICGLGDAGVVCVTRDSTAVTSVRSTWPDRGAALWITDLDGDRQPDWCVATPAGPACSLARDAWLTTEGIAWGYARGGAVQDGASEGALPDTATAVFTDVDGDGRNDLCSAQDGVIACARSLGRSFGPRTTVARLPAGMVPTAVWAEPAHGELAPRICAGDATTIACTD
jgi:LmbE family N-acetylglucosaminyl deacetylase